MIYINDIDDCVVGKILTFPDDTKIHDTMYSDEDAPCSLIEVILLNGPRNGKCFLMPTNAKLCMWDTIIRKPSMI